jgi:hypothetical protein
MNCVVRAILAACLLVSSACRAGPASDSTGVRRAEYGARASAETTFTGMRGSYAAYRVRLQDRRGRPVTGRLLRPARAGPARRYAAVLLQDGRELNSGAIEFLPADFGEVIVLSLDYPEELPYEIDLWRLLTSSDRLQRAAGRIAPMLSLGADYLVSRADVDVSRLVMVATSFAVPFAVIAAASDTRFVNVGLVYGAGKMEDVVAANLTIRPRALRRAAAWIAMRPFADFAPERYIARVAPRPVVMVNGIDDPQMPRRAVEALYAKAREPKRLIWLRTGHLMPGDSALIRTLVDTTLVLLPALSQASSRTSVTPVR